MNLHVAEANGVTPHPFFAVQRSCLIIVPFEIRSVPRWREATHLNAGGINAHHYRSLHSVVGLLFEMEYKPG